MKLLLRPLQLSVLVVFGLTATLSILNGGQLVPDTQRYATGKAWYASPLASLAGTFYGLHGVQTLAIAGIYGLVRLVWTNQQRYLGLALAIGLALGPWAPALYCAGVDAISAVVLAILWGTHRKLVPFVLLVHVATGLAAILSLAISRWFRLDAKLLLLGSCFGEILVMRVSRIITHSTEVSQMQWRYLVPFLAVTAISSANLHFSNAGEAEIELNGLDSAPQHSTSGASDYLHRPGLHSTIAQDSIASSANSLASAHFACHDPEEAWIAIVRQETAEGGAA